MNRPVPGTPDSTPIVQLSIAYWGSQALFAANRLGLFELLGEGPLEPEAIAGRLGLSVRPTRLLLEACAALGLLERTGASYANTELSRSCLVKGTPAYLGDAIRYGEDMYAAWGRLEDLVRTGKPTLKAESYLGADRERTRHFVYGMHNRALGPARALVEMVDLTGRRALLDVGGGPGTYSALFAERFSELKGEVLDLPDVAALGREILDSMPGGDRIASLPGDYHSTPFPGGKDVVLISGVFHRETEETCRGLIARAHEALLPGGLLLISDVFTHGGGPGSAFAALFGLNMALCAPNGGVHSDAEVASWMGAAGFDLVQTKPFPAPMPHRLVSGRRH